MRTVMALGAAAVTVLGNHDLHLLTVAARHRKPHRHDTLDPILDAPDRDELLAWLRTRPLVVREGDLLLVHAGLLALVDSRPPRSCFRAKSRPCWPPTAHDDFLRHLYGDLPARWDDSLIGYDRLRVIVNACTRLRYCTADDTMELAEKRGPAHSAAGLRALVRAPRTQVRRRHGIVRPLVDAGSDARTARRDARLGMPLGRHADRAQAGRSAGIPGAESAAR